MMETGVSITAIIAVTSFFLSFHAGVSTIKTRMYNDIMTAQV